ncbi:hypothetical protein F1880_001231 [Penicillium rolfsii]|nr:hypothetical protein F1880_001231 [Penicillium rolfsii]
MLGDESARKRANQCSNLKGGYYRALASGILRFESTMVIDGIDLMEDFDPAMDRGKMSGTHQLNDFQK